MSEPLVWQTFETVDIRDIHNENVDNLAEFTVQCQLEDVLLYPTQKDHMYEVFTDFWKYILAQKQSIIAINRETNEIIGVILCLVMTDYMRSWTNLILKITKPRLKVILNLYLLMVKFSNELQPPGTPMDSVQIFRVAVPKRHKGFNWKPRLINAVVRMSECLKMPCITHLAFTMNNQIRALRAGMKEQCRIYYNQYVDEETGTRPFCLTKLNELCVIFFRRDVQPSIPHNKMKEECVQPKRIKSSRRYYKDDDLNFVDLL